MTFFLMLTNQNLSYTHSNIQTNIIGEDIHKKRISDWIYQFNNKIIECLEKQYFSSSEEFKLNFQPLKVVSCYRDTQLQLTEILNPLYLFSRLSALLNNSWKLCVFPVYIPANMIR